MLNKKYKKKEDLEKLKLIYVEFKGIDYNSTKYDQAHYLLKCMIAQLKKINRKKYEETWKMLQICQQKLEIYENKISIGYVKAISFLEELFKKSN